MKTSKYIVEENGKPSALVPKMSRHSELKNKKKIHKVMQKERSHKRVKDKSKKRMTK